MKGQKLPSDSLNSSAECSTTHLRSRATRFDEVQRSDSQSPNRDSPQTRSPQQFQLRGLHTAACWDTIGSLQTMSLSAKDYKCPCQTRVLSISDMQLQQNYLNGKIELSQVQDSYFFLMLALSATHFCCSIRSRSSSILLLSSSSLLSLSSSSCLRFSSSLCNRSSSSSSRRLRSSSSLLQHPLNKLLQHFYNPRTSYLQQAVTYLLPT